MAEPLKTFSNQVWTTKNHVTDIVQGCYKFTLNPASLIVKMKT